MDDESENSPKSPRLSGSCDIPDLEVTDIRRRKDGLFIISSRGEIAMSLSPRQMAIVVATANAEYRYLNQQELHQVVFPNQPVRKLRQAIMTKNGFQSTLRIPLSPSQRASMCRTLHRLSDIGLIDTDGGLTARPNASTKSIAKWVSDHPEVLKEGG